jgi:hypothetical protein
MIHLCVESPQTTIVSMGLNYYLSYRWDAIGVFNKTPIFSNTGSWFKQYKTANTIIITPNSLLQTAMG